MKYTVSYRGAVIREFENVGDMDAYLADRVFEWVELGQGYNAHLGSDYLELVNDRGTRVVLSFTPVESLVSNDTFAQGYPFE